MRKAIALFIAALLLPQAGFCWGKIGHQTVAEIAERNLTAQAKANIERYTGSTPLWQLSLWMDEVRSQNIKPYNTVTAGWHASIADSNMTSPKIVRERYRESNDGVTAIENFTEQLKNYQQLPDSAVLVAIKCMIHTIADFHCPSHLRYVDCENKGGFAVKFYGKQTTMHKVWDTSVVSHYHKGWKHTEYADHLSTLSESEAEKVTEGWAQQWFEQSAVECRPVIYWVDDLTIESLGDKFMEKAGPLAEQQMQRAGYRLAKALNTIFK